MFNKKNSKIGQTTGATFADGFGKTENFDGGFSGDFGGPSAPTIPAGIGKTEALPQSGFAPIGSEIGKTVAAAGAQSEEGGIFAPNSSLQSFGKTVAAELIVRENGEKVQPVVGWLVCIAGPNAGKEFRIHSDYNYLGSQKGDIIIPGDKKISRENHLVIAYDPADRKFYIAPASGANIIRLNDKALIGSGTELKNYDVVKTGDSSFMFIGFCGEQFGWEDVNNA